MEASKTKIFSVFSFVSGTERHELTSWRSFHSIFKFFADALEAQENSDQQPSTTVTTRSANRIKHDEI